MKTKLFKTKIFAFIVVFIEMAGIAFLGISYGLNFFNFKEIFSSEIIFSILGAVVIFDIVFCWALIFRFSKIRQQSDLRAADLIGSDIQEAYNFGMIGLAVVNETNTVIWVNDLFNERKIEILDENILEWQPSLQELIDGGINTLVKLNINSRNYEVKLLKDAGLYIFRDVTDYETVSAFSKRQATVCGQIIIDNYADISGSADENSDIVSKVRNIILDYGRDNQVLLRRVRSDAYFLLCNHESLEKMIADKFSLLDKIHTISENEEIPPTLSIGIAYDFPDVVKLNDMASAAIEIAMSRGGDQVVVSQYGQDLVFFGGKSEAQENRNKVKVRVMADSVLSLIRNSSNIIIMGHAMTDMDSLGACLGVKAMCDYCHKPAQVIYEPKSTERKTKGAIISSFSKEEMEKIFVTQAQALDKLKTNTLVVVCDVHKANMTVAPKVIEKANKIMIIDHHRRGEDFIETPVFSHIDSSASSASEMVAELVSYSSANPRIMIPSEYATIMLSGIFMDSNFYKATTVGTRTFEASMALKEYGADNAKADDFLKDEFEEFALITRIISTTRTPHYGVVYCMADEDDIIEQATLAKVANQCMQMKGVNACFVIGRTGVDETRISCRSDGTINVQLLAEKLNGGGHFTQAACTFKKMTLVQVETRLLNVLTDYLNDARII
ncbi:MAG: DHH family phosphoesterase [Firmicutes bacterium]|nr:DHH family phosphoesterase [Candidatus Fiminaster equi]